MPLSYLFCANLLYKMQGIVAKIILITANSCIHINPSYRFQLRPFHVPRDGKGGDEIHPGNQFFQEGKYSSKHTKFFPEHHVKSEAGNYRPHWAEGRDDVAETTYDVQDDTSL